MMQVRDFLPEDKEAYLTMATDLFNGPAAVHALPLSYLEHTFKEILAGSPYLRGLILEEAGQVAGYCQLAFVYNNEIDGMYVWMDELYIKPEFRSKGLGSQMFQWVFAEYRGKAKKLRFEVAPDNTDALRLYRRLGFTEWPYIQFTKDFD
jgi:ribosomal protein S18 acetylase RimI-like enzyme